jgi:hypothetical protein
MVRVGLQLTIWLPVVVVVVLTAAVVCKLVRVCSVTDAAPLTIVGIPAEYPMVLAVKVSNPESRSVEIAYADHPLTRVVGARRVSVTVTVSSCAVVAVTVSGDAKLPKFPATGTLIDNPPVKGFTIKDKLVEVAP